MRSKCRLSFLRRRGQQPLMDNHGGPGHFLDPRLVSAEAGKVSAGKRFRPCESAADNRGDLIRRI